MILELMRCEADVKLARVKESATLGTIAGKFCRCSRFYVLTRVQVIIYRRRASELLIYRWRTRYCGGSSCGHHWLIFFLHLLPNLSQGLIEEFVCRNKFAHPSFDDFQPIGM